MSKLAIVTGTSSGIGKALAERLLADGWKVFGIARREVKFDGDYLHVQADLSDPAVAANLGPRIEAEMAFSAFTRLALVNNAASPGQKRSYGDQRGQATYRNIATNLAAPMALMDLAVHLRPEGAALRVVNISSGLAYRPLAGASDYCASKAGLHMAGEVLAEEDHPDTAVLSYAPGIVDTEMQQSLRSEDPEEFSSVAVFRAMHEEGRLAAPEAVVGPIVDFLEDDAITGFHQDRYEPS
ncbi:MAG: SDR family NAD(P)-dependent oxidoreductase [Xanthomonadales bacterium]|jgi:benzil reductase ((S)-benzoin forming)|nr:SDR family NAD(P)-dependent oxidoreductase [Xanthomonadales bacterium]